MSSKTERHIGGGAQQMTGTRKGCFCPRRSRKDVSKNTSHSWLHKDTPRGPGLGLRAQEAVQEAAKIQGPKVAPVPRHRQQGRHTPQGGGRAQRTALTPPPYPG